MIALVAAAATVVLALSGANIPAVSAGAVAAVAGVMAARAHLGKPSLWLAGSPFGANVDASIELPARHDTRFELVLSVGGGDQPVPVGAVHRRGNTTVLRFRIGLSEESHEGTLTLFGSGRVLARYRFDRRA